MREQEQWDLIDRMGKSLGETIEKGAFHPEGTYHLVIGVWVIAPDGRALITKRSEEEVQYPGLWENTGGCAKSGEDGVSCAIRELKEETGIEADAEEMRLLGVLLEQTAYVQIYGFSIREISENLQLQYTEVTDAKWVTRLAWEQMIQEGCVSGAALRRMRAVEKQLEAMGFIISEGTHEAFTV